MKNILVSGASGIIGYGILRSLKRSGKNLALIGTTIYPDSAAQGFCDIFEQAIPTNDLGYLNWLLGVIKKYKVCLIIPGIEADMYEWSKHLAEFDKAGVKVVLNKKELISLCNDKWIFYEKLKSLNSPYAIETSLENDFDVLSKKFGLPFLLKPRCGHGSKGIVKVNSKDIFLQHQKDIGTILMAQPIVGNDDEEYSTSAFCDGNGNFSAQMTIRRKLSVNGYTEKAEVVEVNEMKEALKSLCSFLKPIGPTNFQFRMEKGALKLLEINPRISSATSIRTAFGYNESDMVVDYFLEGKIPSQPMIKQGTAVRYTDDLIFYK